MLSVMICEPNERIRAMLLAQLEALSERFALKIAATTSSVDDMERYLQAETGIVLAIFGCTLRPKNNREKCLQLGEALMRRSRDSYTVYLIHDLDDLGAVLGVCSRPAGILLTPFPQAQMEECLTRIVLDYDALNSEQAPQGTLLLNVGATTHRIPFDQIRYIEALDKKLNIYTRRQTITVRATLSTLLGDLPEQFYRCHRSYVVNVQRIRETDFSAMELTLESGERLPISRSSRDGLRQQMTQRGNGA
ncbi:MAG: LytTR family transcriptional regulator DNA-binding domain-containing protein [Clostridia bacterium]|nr:LytTR family transcriptional regulator DNA-binding domain-containing protein [Clostridia bacterium]